MCCSQRFAATAQLKPLPFPPDMKTPTVPPPTPSSATDAAAGGVPPEPSSTGGNGSVQRMVRRGGVIHGNHPKGEEGIFDRHREIATNQSRETAGWIKRVCLSGTETYSIARLYRGWTAMLEIASPLRRGALQNIALRVTSLRGALTCKVCQWLIRWLHEKALPPSENLRRELRIRGLRPTNSLLELRRDERNQEMSASHQTFPANC